MVPLFFALSADTPLGAQAGVAHHYRKCLYAPQPRRADGISLPSSYFPTGNQKALCDETLYVTEGM